MLWLALCAAPDDGADIAELMRADRHGPVHLYRYLAQLAEQGRAIQVGWGRWRAARPGDEATMSNCLSQLSLSLASRVSARKGAETDRETNAETSYPQAPV